MEQRPSGKAFQGWYRNLVKGKRYRVLYTIANQTIPATVLNLIVKEGTTGSIVEFMYNISQPLPNGSREVSIDFTAPTTSARVSLQPPYDLLIENVQLILLPDALPITPKGNVTSRQNGFPIFRAVQVGTDAPISTTDVAGNSILTLVGATNKVDFNHDIFPSAKYKLRFRIEWPTGATNKTFTLTHQGLAYYNIDYPAGGEYATISFGAGPQSNSLSLEFNSAGAKLSEISYEVQSTPTLINDNGNALLADYKLIGEDQGWSRATNSEGDLVLTPNTGAAAACTLQKTVTGLVIGRTYRLLVAVPTANAPASQSLASITMAGSTSPLWVIAANDATQGRNATYFNTESPRSGNVGVTGSGIREYYLVFKATANAVTIDYLGAKINNPSIPQLHGKVLCYIKLIQEPIYDGYAEEDGYRYGFNGKENLSEIYGEGVLQDYGFRIYNTNIARFLSVDPLRNKYPELTTYQFASNRPLQCIDLDGLEAYFSNSGEFVKWGPDQSETAPVIITETKETLPINFKEFMNRVNWAYGEGGGMASEYYAHTIENISKRDGEDQMYKHMYAGGKVKRGTAEEQRTRFFEGSSGGDNYQNFKKYRKDYSKDISKVNNKDYDSKMVRRVIASTINAITKKTNDPTNGASSWAGEEGSIIYAQQHSKLQTTIYVVREKTAFKFPSCNIFYKEANFHKKLNDLIENIELNKKPAIKKQIKKS